MISQPEISNSLRSSSVSKRKSLTDLGNRFRKPSFTFILEKRLGKMRSIKGRIVAF